jgi:hypothetical protein
VKGVVRVVRGVGWVVVGWAADPAVQAAGVAAGVVAIGALRHHQRQHRVGGGGGGRQGGVRHR